MQNTDPTTRSGERRPFWQTTAALAAIGATTLTLSGCGEKVATAESATTVTAEATTTASPTQSPTETATEQPSAPESSESENTSESGAFERIEKTPEYQAYVESISPEALAKLSSEADIRGAFRITNDNLPSVDTAGDPISTPEAYGAFFIASQHGLQNAGSTPAEVSPFDGEYQTDVEGYLTYVNSRYVLPAVDELTLEAATYNPENHGHQEYYIGQTTFGKYYRNGDANEPYRTIVTPLEIAVIDNGDGYTDTFSLDVKYNTVEDYDEEAALMQMGIANPPLNVDEFYTLLNVTKDPSTGALKPLTIQDYERTVNNS